MRLQLDFIGEGIHWRVLCHFCGQKWLKEVLEENKIIKNKEYY